jgi:radical SAM/Cys-rich protein
MTTTSTPITALTIEGRNDFDARVEAEAGRPLHAASLSTFQVNIGLTCNLACHHCHVESSPSRDEQMDWPTMLLVLDAMRRAGAGTLDITGGAPEMNRHFRAFVEAAVHADLHVIVRTNLTIMLADGYTDLPEWFAQHGVHLVASLPCYLESNVDRQRGQRVYVDSIEVIRRLNAVGYGVDPTRALDLVYNPVTPDLPPDQRTLEDDYRRHLADAFGIAFTKLITITNMPIGRFLHDLERDGQAGRYMNLLRSRFNPRTVEPLMCRHQVHVSHDGTVYDCDFNYALGLPVEPGAARHIGEFDPQRHARRRIVTGEHCFGCTAGAGSSCGGALA